MVYIENRPEAIEAIHECIDKKWNRICMCALEIEPDCHLCDLYNNPRVKDGATCSDCPLGITGNICIRSQGSTYGKWYEKAALDCLDCKGCEFHEGSCPVSNHPEEAEAMLEALVQLLPPEERRRYEP